MRVYFVRHGIAIDPMEPGSPAEAERFLTEEGRKKTRAAARGFKALGAKAEVFFSSPYLRARQTAEIFAEVLGFPPQKIRRSGALLPMAEPAEIFEQLDGIKAEGIACFGHAPHLDLAITLAAGGRHPITALKKTGAACVKLESFHPPSGEIEWILTAKMLRNLRASGSKS